MCNMRKITMKMMNTLLEKTLVRQLDAIITNKNIFLQ